MGINQIVLDGNLATDPRLEILPSGTPKTSFLLGHNRHFVDKSGESREESMFFWVECFGRIAITVSEHLVKGREVTVTGSLSNGVIRTKDNAYKNCTCVKADYVKFGAKRPENGNAANQPVEEKECAF